MKALLLLLFSASFGAAAQSVLFVDGKACGRYGLASANSPVYNLNALKNRFAPPQESEIDTTITFQRLLQSASPDAFSPYKAVRLTGYVASVKMGGVESCNCRSKAAAFRDTHIELTPDKAHTGAAYRLIAEVTPRLRLLLARQGTDWSTNGLRRRLKGRTITITGWLLYDTEHQSGAEANDPGDARGDQNWRGTCWEVHPVTAIQIAGEPAEAAPASRDREAPAPELPTQDKPVFTYLLGALFVFIVLLVLVLAARRKR